MALPSGGTTGSTIRFFWTTTVATANAITSYFARAGFEPEDACRVSFVELLHIPTIGGSERVAKDLDSEHLDRLNTLIQHGAKRNVFLSNQVIRLMLDSRRFPGLPKPIAKQVLPKLHKIGETTIYQHLHFSNYGAFQSRMKLEAAAIARLRTDSPNLTPCAC